MKDDLERPFTILSIHPISLNTPPLDIWTSSHATDQLPCLFNEIVESLGLNAPSVRKEQVDSRGITGRIRRSAFFCGCIWDSPHSLQEGRRCIVRRIFVASVDAVDLDGDECMRSLRKGGVARRARNQVGRE